MDHTSKIRMKSVTKYVRKTQTFKHLIEQDDEKTTLRRVIILLTYSPLLVSIPMYALLMLSSPTFKFSAHVKKEKNGSTCFFSVIVEIL